MPSLDASRRPLRLSASLASGGPEAGPIDALVVTDLTNIRWLSGFTGSSATMVVRSDGTSLLITDGRYAERAEADLSAVDAPCEVLIGRTQEIQRELLVEQLGEQQVIGLEAAHVSWARADELRIALGHASVVGTTGLVEALRRTKSPAEVARTARACAIADAAFESVVHLLGTGVTETAFARAFGSAVLDHGGDDVSFPSIIASGPNASRPHHAPGGRRVADGDLVICDLGALYGGYHSDMTRTVAVGDVSTAQRRHVQVVRAAHAAGIAAIAPGVEAKAIDAACREVVAAAGWADHFVHGTGHGTGLLIHEIPFAGQTSTDVLQAGDLLTIEPGVYLPGSSGVRIEDLTVVTVEGPVVLTRTPLDVAVAAA
jgi:Xaa-Pro aminopeptidase